MRKKVEKPTEDLQKLIELANLAPLKPKPLSSSEFIIAEIYYKKTGKVFPQNTFDGSHFLDNSLFPNDKEIRTHSDAKDEALEEIKKITKKYPFFYHYIFDETEETQYNYHGQALRFQQLQRYDSVLSIQKLLVDIAIQSTLFIENFGLEKFSRNSYLVMSEIVFPFDCHTINGKLHFEITHITKTLEGIDASRLRWCKVCLSVFWANRLDTKYCPTKKCGDIFRVKDFRNKKAEKEKLRNHERRKFLNQDFSKK